MSGYDFSPLYNSSLTAFSPGSTFLASAHAHRLVVRSTSNLSIVRTWALTLSSSPSSKSKSRIDAVQWSDDGLYLLAHVRAEGAVWVFALAQEGRGLDGEVVKIKAGVEGLEVARWARGGREVLCWSEHNLRLTVYDPSSGHSRMIHNPKSSGADGHAYSPDGRYLAFLERHGGKDCVGVYDTAVSFQLTRHFALSTSDAQAISWSPCGRFIAVTEGWLSYAVHVHSPIGPLISTFTVPFASASSSTEDPGLGVRHLAWTSGGQHVVLAGWDGRLRVVEATSGRCVGQTNPIRRSGKDVTTWQEPSGWLKDTRGRGIVQFDRVGSVPLPTVPANLTPDPPLAGITHLVPSPSGSHVATVQATQPDIVHITTLPHPGGSGAPSGVRDVAKMIFASPVRALCWGAKDGREKLAVVCKSGAVYTWEKEGWVDEGEAESEAEGEGGVAEGVGIPNVGQGYIPADVYFSPDGGAVIVQGKREFCVMYDEGDSEDGPGLSEAMEETVKEWETEGLSQVMEGEEDSEEEGEQEADDTAGQMVYRPMALKGRAWRPSDGGMKAPGILA